MNAVDIINEMMKKVTEICNDKEKGKIEKGNKSAAIRARKVTLELAELGKQFRKITLSKDKEE